MARLVVLVPCYARALDPACDEALRQLEARGIPVRRIAGHASIDQARSQMATDALEAGFDELLWVDADVVFDPKDVDHIRNLGEPLVAGLYPKKGKRVLAAHMLPGVKRLVFGPRQGAPGS
jgi:hypothetical protein